MDEFMYEYTKIMTASQRTSRPLRLSYVYVPCVCIKLRRCRGYFVCWYQDYLLEVPTLVNYWLFQNSFMFIGAKDWIVVPMIVEHLKV